jgi:benzoate/toluate 1,2-dioxygenase subunit beta
MEEIISTSNFLIVELKRGVETIFAGRTEFQLRLEENELKIGIKKVVQINNNEPL